jgi:hypothetical protein
MDEIGGRLREARMRAKIDINEVELRTKIRAKYLRAIENEEWDLLPGDVYAKSFIRTYGEYLGLDTLQLIEDFKRHQERPSDNELRPIAPRSRDRERDRRPRGPLIPPWLAVALVLVAIVVVLAIVGLNTGNKGATTSTQASTPTTHTVTRHKPKHKKPRPTLVRLQLVPTGAVYVCLTDGAGKALIPGLTYNAGQTIPTKTASKLLLTLGNNSVQMKVNGLNVPVAASSGAINYELLPGSHRLVPPPAHASCT